MSESSSKPRKSLLRPIAFGLALVTLLVYLPARHHSFIRLDDADYVAANPMVQSGLTWSGVAWALTTYHANNWHPLTWLSHMLDWQLFGPNAGAHHIVNFMFHTANSVLLFLFWYRATRAVWAAALVAALFAWHPLHVESVAWVSERKDVLSTLLFVLTLLAYQRFAEDRSASSRPTPTSLISSRRGLTVLVLFALGLMAKPMLVTLPFVLLLLDYWPLHRMNPGRLESGRIMGLTAEKIPLFILSAVSCVLTYQAQRADAVVSLEYYPFTRRLGNALISYVQYLFKTFWPVDLAVFYPLPTELNSTHLVLAAMLLLAVTFGVVRVIRSRRYLAVGWFWFLGTLVPVIGLLQVGDQAIADRYTYIPSVGIFAALAFAARDGIAAARVKIWPVAVGASLVLAGCVVATRIQVSYWRDSEALFRHAVEVTEHNAKAHQILGFALAGKGRPEEAAQQFQTALKLAPRLHGAHNDLGVILESWGRTNEALQHYQTAVQLRPQNATFQANLGLLLFKLGRMTEAATCYTAAVQLEPNNPNYHFLRGCALQSEGRGNAAIEDFRAALRLAPDDLDIALHLCRTWASDPSPQVRNGAEAVALAQRLNQLTRGEQAPVLDALAMAYAETGQFDRASDLLARTLAVIPPTNTSPFVEGMRARLKLYQSHLPYRENPTAAPPATPDQPNLPPGP